MKAKFIALFFLISIPLPSFPSENTLKIFWPLSEISASKFYDPAGYSFIEDWLILNNLYNGLVKLDPYQRILPDLADFWKISSDGLKYEFLLKKNVKFHNGKNVEAEDFLKSIERLYKIALKRDPIVMEFFRILTGRENSSFEEVKKRIIIKSKYEIEIRISKKYPFFLSFLANPAFKIVYEEKNGKLIGSGPFFIENIERKKVSLVRNPNYFEGIPLIERIILIDYLGIPVEERFSLFKKGDVDIFPSPGNKFFKLPADADATEMEEELYSFTFIALNLSIPPFNNRDFRKALFLGINRKRIAEELGNHCVYFPYVIPRKLHRYEVPLPYGEYDFPKAKKIIEEIQKADKIEPIYLPFYSETPFSKKFLTLIEEEFSKLGLILKPKKISEEEYWKMLDKKKFQIFFETYHADFPEAFGIIYPLFYSKSPVNSSNYSNPEVDRLIIQAMEENNYSKRIKIYQKIESIIYRDIPIIPLFTDKDVWIVRKNIEGLKISYNGLVDTDLKIVKLKK
jgi:ABC-type transport system substrate-binding protein